MNGEAREHCGLFGVYGVPKAAFAVYYGLFALQHRGQESAGVVVSDRTEIRSRKGSGLLYQAVDPGKLDSMPGDIAIGHVRYSTKGAGRPVNIQPLVVESGTGILAVAHNGTLTNAREIRRRYEARGSIFQTSTDSESVVHILADPGIIAQPDPMASALGQLRGSFCMIFLRKDELIAARDLFGFRPLCLGKLGEGWVVASESCALDQVGAVYQRDIEPGEVLSISQKGLVSSRVIAQTPPRPAHCVFELIYFARPDSLVFNRSVHEVRTALGRQLAKDFPVKADIVVPVPDSGNSAALGYAHESGISIDRGFVRNHYIGRTFIMPSQKKREGGVDLKLNVIRQVVAGKRVIVVDDSIVRGTTCRRRIQQLRAAGATEVHLRISCPPICHPCYYGIDFPDRKDLIAAQTSVEEIAKKLEVDSLAYLSIEGLRKAAGENPQNFCYACFSGNYPVSVPNDEQGKLILGCTRKGD